MALPDWCTRLDGTRTVGKGILLVFLLLVTSLVVYPQVTTKRVVLVVDGDAGLVVTRAKTVGRLLEDSGLYVRTNDILTPSEETRLEKGMEIRLRRAIPVFLQADGQTRLVYTVAENVAQLLDEVKVPVGIHDRVEPGLTEPLQQGASLHVVRVKAERIDVEVPIPYKTRQVNDSQLDLGRRNVVVEGKPGVMIRTYDVLYVDGREEERVLVAENRVSEPVAGVVHVGTREAAPLVTASARDGRAHTAIEGIASWYGAKFHGNKTAYGDIFDMNKLTAAFPSREMAGKTLRVTYIKTGRSVDVLVNDYGPHTGGRVIDLSKAAARAIGLMADGIGKVRIEVIE